MPKPDLEFTVSTNRCSSYSCFLIVWACVAMYNSRSPAYDHAQCRQFTTCNVALVNNV